MLTFEQIKELIELVTESHLQGVEIERSGFRLRIDGRPGLAGVTGAAAEPTLERSVVAAPAATVATAPVPTAAAERAEATSELSQDGHVVRSPIVGTFYTAASPDADPYAKVGDHVEKGQVLCIVEAMKLMNEIESDVDGKLLSIYPKNGQPVEFGEPLFAIQTD